MGIYDGMEETIKKQQAVHREPMEPLLAEIKTRMYPLVIEGIDGFAEMAVRVGKPQKVYKKDLLFLADMITLHVWEIYWDPKNAYGITKKGVIYKAYLGTGVPRQPYTAVDRVSKKELADKMVAQILSERDGDLKNWDYQAAVKTYFTRKFTG